MSNLEHSKIDKYLDENLKIQESGLYSFDNIFERIKESRIIYTKRENLFHFASAIAFSLYLIKTIGIDFDLIIFENSISKSPYGIFLFCVICQLCNIIALSQSLNIIYCDLVLINVQKRSICDKNKNEMLSNPNSAEYFGENITVFRKMDLGLFSKFVYWIVFLISSFLGLIFSIGSIGAGIHFLLNYETQITHGNLDWQYYPVLIFTALNLLWLLFLFIVTSKAR